MPNQDWVKRRDSELAGQAAVMQAAVAAAAAAYGSTAGEMTQMQTLVQAFADNLALMDDPATRTEVVRQEKDTAKTTLVAFMRSLGRRIQANPAVTAAMKVAATLPVHQTEPTPTPVPGSRPTLKVVKVAGSNVVILVTDEFTPTRRARPVGCAGYEIFSWVVSGGAGNETPPADLEKWRYEGQSTRAEATIGYNAEDVGKTVIIVARWFNRKAQVGAVSDPVIAVVAGAMAA
jgi:hypothetical protein